VTSSGLGIIVRDAVRDVLQKRRLARLGLADDHAALALADGRHEVYEPYREPFAAGSALRFEGEPLVGEYGDEVFERPALNYILRRAVVHRGDVKERHVLIVLA